MKGREKSAFILIIALLVLTAFVQAEEVIITYKNDSGSDYRDSSIAPEKNLEVKYNFSQIDAYVVEVSDEEKKVLEKNPEIEISENRKYHVSLNTAGPLINSSIVWNSQLGGINITGEGTSVCVVDTGVDYTHADLGGCTTESFLAGTCSRVIGGYDFVDDNNDPMDEHIFGHGTHVAGIIASSNSVYKGTAPSTGIVAMRVLGPDGSGSPADVNSAIDWCINNSLIYNITSISLSLGDEEYYTDHCVDAFFSNLVSRADEKNISIVVAAGNCDGKTPTTCNGDLGVSHPACVEGIIPVGAVDNSDIQNYQRWLNWQVLAPGVSITSLKYPGGGTRVLSGTSMATPFVSATIALLQQYSQLKNHRSLNSTEIITALNTTSTRITDGVTGVVYPRLNAYEALGTLTNPRFSSINHANISTYNTSDLTLPLGIVFTEEVDFTYSINGSANKTGCTGCNSFNQTIALPAFGNLTFNFYIIDSVGNSNFTDRTIYINQTSPTFSNASYIGESTIPLITEDASGQETNISNLNIYINNSNDLDINYTEGNYTVNITDNTNQTVLEFNYTLNNTNTTLDLSTLVLMRGNTTSTNNSYLIIRGLNLTTQDRTKTIYLEKHTTSNNTCIRDAETFSIGEFSPLCNGASEYLVNCPGTTGNYNCNLTENNTHYKISGLAHSAIKETGDFCGDGKIDSGETCSTCSADAGACAVPSSGSSSSGSRGGGGTPTVTLKKITPTPYEMKEGFTTTVEKNNAIIFKTLDGEDHNITIEKINPLSIKLTINSEPITLLLVAGEERKLNLTSPNFYNLYLKVNLIEGERANIRVQNIFEAIISNDEEPPVSEEPKIPVYKDYRAYLYFLTAVALIILLIFTNRKLNKLEKENRRKEGLNILANNETIKPKTQRKR